MARVFVYADDKLSNAILIDVKTNSFFNRFVYTKQRIVYNLQALPYVVSWSSINRRCVLKMNNYVLSLFFFHRINTSPPPANLKASLTGFNW